MALNLMTITSMSCLRLTDSIDVPVHVVSTSTCVASGSMPYYIQLKQTNEVQVTSSSVLG